MTNITKSAHTPGPWNASEPNGRGQGWMAGPAWLGENAWSDQTAADAHLIAAAPELLEALVALHAAATVGDEDYAAITNAAAAILKATGEPK
jgi:hypothetical protein